MSGPHLRVAEASSTAARREGVPGKTVKTAGSPPLYSESCRDEATCFSVLASRRHSLGPGSFSQTPLRARWAARCGPAGTSVTGEADDLNAGFSCSTVQLGGRGSAPALGLLLSERQRILKDRNFGADHNDSK